MQGAEAVWEISKILTFSSERTPPANISTAQKYGPNSFASVEDMTWPQLSPKQLVSISHATPDLIPQPGTIRNPGQKKKKNMAKIFQLFFEKEKIYKHGPLWIASGCHIKLVAFWSKQKGSISHAAPCELWEPPNFHLSVSNPKPLNRHAYA